MFDGASGAWPKFIGHWFLRAVLIVPGLIIGGVRDRRIIPAALASSTMVSLFLMFYTAVSRGKHSAMQMSSRRRVRGNLRSGTRHTATQRMSPAEQRILGLRKRAAQRRLAKHVGQRNFSKR